MDCAIFATIGPHLGGRLQAEFVQQLCAPSSCFGNTFCRMGISFQLLKIPTEPEESGGALQLVFVCLPPVPALPPALPVPRHVLLKFFTRTSQLPHGKPCRWYGVPASVGIRSLGSGGSPSVNLAQGEYMRQLPGPFCPDSPRQSPSLRWCGSAGDPQTAQGRVTYPLQIFFQTSTVSFFAWVLGRYSPIVSNAIPCQSASMNSANSLLSLSCEVW